MKNTQPTNTELKNTSAQTPIEIALQIDENGMTTASNLYSFLELNSTHFSRWCNKNIVNNKFATENEDYIIFAPDGENSKIQGGRPKTDYKLTSDFAKKLSMTGNTERHEQARQYFVACEQGLKIATKKLQESQSIDKLADILSSINNRLTTLEEQQSKKKLPKKKYSRWKTNTFNKLNTLLLFANKTTNKNYKLPEIIHNVINETEDIYQIEINDYMEAYKSEFELDENPYVIDVINHYRDIRDMFQLTLDSIMERLHITENRQVKPNIFDEIAEKLNNERIDKNDKSDYDNKQ